MLYQKNGLIAAKDLISIEDRAFMYGDGCFTTARWSDGKIQLWSRHLQRFSQAIDALQLNCTLHRLEQEIQQFITQLAQYKYGTIKIVLSRGVSARGYALPHTDCDIYCYFYPANTNTQPIIIEQIGIMPEALGSSMLSLKGIKTLNRLEQVMLKATAQKYAWQEALCVDQQNNLVEAISSNCFVYLDGEWLSPDLHLTGIAGTMRQEILTRLQHYQIKHQIRMIAQAEIAQIEAVFLCNALQPMAMVQKIVNLHGQVQQLQLAPCQNLFQQLSLHQLV